MRARAGADVDEVVRRAHRVLIVLDNDERVAKVAQSLERGEQLVVVALVQSDGRLVEDIEDAHQARADLRRQTDALRFAAGERRARARERQVFESYRAQEAEAVFDLLQNALADAHLLLRERELIHKVERVDHGFFAIVTDAKSADRDGEGFAPQSLAAATGAGALAHAALELFAHAVALRFLIAALQVGDHALKGLIQNALAARLVVLEFQLFPLRAIQDDVHDLFGEFFHRIAEGEVVLFRQRFKIHARDAVAADVVPARGADRAVEQGNALVRDDELGVDLELRAETRALRARAEGIVEREHARRQLLDGDAAVLAGVVLREEDVAVVGQDIGKNDAARERRRGLAGVRQAVNDVGTEDQAVDDDLDVVLFVLLEGNFLTEVVHVPVGADADIARAARVLENFHMLALFPANDRRHDLHARALAQRHELVDDLVNGLLANFLAAVGAVRRADARPQKAQIVVHLRHRADGGAGILRGGLLVDGNGGGEALDIVDVGLFLLPKEHTGVGRQALHIAALALGIDGVERERRLAAARKSRDDGQRVAGDFHVDVLEVILSCAFDKNLTWHESITPVAHFAAAK